MVRTCTGLVWVRSSRSGSAPCWGGEPAGDSHHLLLAAGQGARRLLEVRLQLGEEADRALVGV